MNFRLIMAISERGMRWKIFEKVNKDNWKLVGKGEYEIKGRKLLFRSCKISFSEEKGILVYSNGEWKPYDGFYIMAEGNEGMIVFNCMGKGKLLKISPATIRFLLFMLDIPIEDKIKMRDIIFEVLEDYLNLIKKVNV